MTEQTQEQPELNLTVQDLTLMANIIDLAVQRGAFKGAEAETVGTTFNKLVNIIRAIAPPAPETNEAENSEAAEAE